MLCWCFFSKMIILRIGEMHACINDARYRNNNPDDKNFGLSQMERDTRIQFERLPKYGIFYQNHRPACAIGVRAPLWPVLKALRFCPFCLSQSVDPTDVPGALSELESSRSVGAKKLMDNHIPNV